MEQNEPSENEPSKSKLGEALLSRKVSDLPLRIKSTHLESLIFQLYQELDNAGIVFKPSTYLSDIWGCPNEVPTIGIPFYLANPLLCDAYALVTGTSYEDDQTIMMLLRHEAGHAFNYAYRLYERPDWQHVFGRFSLPYRDAYRPDPLSNQFVCHLPGYYAQKHPDDDFAETFAVWLTPLLKWPRTYAGTPALAKLRYVNHIAAIYGRKAPDITGGKLDMPFEEIQQPLGKWLYRVVLWEAAG